MKRKFVGGLLVGFILLLMLIIVGFIVNIKETYIKILLLIFLLDTTLIIYSYIRKDIGMKKKIKLFVSLLVPIVAIVMMVSFQFSLFTDFGLDNILTLHFDEIEGNKVVDSTNGIYGIIHGTKITEGLIGNAMEFDGDDDYIEINATNFPSTFERGITLSFWMKGDNLTSDRRDSPISRLNKNQFFVYSNNKEDSLIIGVFSDGKELTKKCKVRDKKWNHIIISFGDGIKINVNGNVCINNARRITLDSSDANIFLGSYYNKGNNFDGVIDELLIYNRGFKDKELKSFYFRQSILRLF